MKRKLWRAALLWLFLLCGVMSAGLTSSAAGVSGVKIKSVSVASDGAVWITWTKNGNANGYEVLIVMDDWRSGNRTSSSAGIASNAITKMRVTGLPMNNKYSIQIRAYKVSPGGVEHSAWSSKKNFWALTPVTLASVVPSGKAAMKIKWKKNSVLDGYEVRCYRNKNLTGGSVKKVIKGNKKSSITGKGFSKGTYYVCVRGYVLDGKKKVYTEWSKARSCKVK